MVEERVSDCLSGMQVMLYMYQSINQAFVNGAPRIAISTYFYCEGGHDSHIIHILFIRQAAF